MTCGISIVTGWPSIAASASMPPTPQPSTPRPLTIVVCESVPTSVSGIRALHAVLVVREHDAREVLEVDLVHDAGVRRHDLEVAERRLAPAQERIAFDVAAELDRVVLGERIRGAVVVDLHRVVDDQFGRGERVDLLRVAAEADHRLAHGGEVDDGRHAGEVLQDHARGREGDFVARGRLGVPVEQRLDVLRA